MNEHNQALIFITSLIIFGLAFAVIAIKESQPIALGTECRSGLKQDTLYAGRIDCAAVGLSNIEPAGANQ